MARLPYLKPYDPGFLGDGFQVPLLAPQCRGRLLQGGQTYDYIHYSLVMHQDRRMALYTAHNVDVSQRRSASRTGWDLDPRIDRTAQTGPAAYANNPWDRGHLVRRAAVVWGSAQEARDASDSTFYYPNASLQHAKFNQDEWLALEDWVLQSAGDVSSRLCVFTGPIYTKKDPSFNEFRIPSAFWKVVVLRDPTAGGDDLAALGFVMKQNELWGSFGGAAMLDLKLYQVGIGEIGRYAGLDFGLLATLDEFEWRQPRFRNRSRMRPVEIRGPEDIRFFGDRRRRRGIRALRIGGPEEGGAAAAALGRSRPCGCPDDEASVEDQVQALTREVEALREVTDALLDDRAGRSRSPRALADARERFARIVGGQATASGEFPECALIGNADGWFCSGVLVHPRVVVTAAHCAPDISRVYLAGRSINLIGVRGEVVDVERVIVHPDYDPYRVPSHDIAVLILKSEADTAPVEIAAVEQVDGEDNLTLVGFGYEHPTAPVGFGTKRQVDVPLTSVAGLTADEVRDVEWVHGYDSAHELHAGRKELGRDSCNGDSGGPAYLGLDDDRRLAGVTSRAAFSSELPCGDGGIYTRITPYLSWMADATGGLVGGGEEEERPAGGRPYIRAAQPNPAGRDAGNEWVEIANAGSADVSLEGMAIADKQGGRHALAGVLSPGEVRRVVLPEGSAVKLGNRGDDIVLLRGDQEVHRVSYDSAGSGEVKSFQMPEHDPDDGDNGDVDPDDTALLEADPC